VAEVLFCFLVLTGTGSGGRGENWRPPTDLTFMPVISNSLYLLLFYLPNEMLHLQLIAKKCSKKEKVSALW
jgi:hypothetical protein